MNLDLEQKLKSRHPRLLRDLRRQNAGTPIARDGITCRDGWFALIDDLCGRIEAASTDDDVLRVAQIKEKFAELRFYLHEPHRAPDEVRLLIEAARARSRTVCEICGQPGALYEDQRWFHIYCVAHAIGQAVPPESGS